ncbi:MAG: hypothetical protein H8D92_01735 [Pelagibacteraceae bacterium]|nr:hypothetical protein [Pelagibacteraceae bacterium]
MEIKNAPDHITDYRMVKLTDGTLLVGSVVVDDKFLRIENPLQLQTIQRMTEYGMKDDSSLSPWIPFTKDKSFNIAVDKIIVISLAAPELAHYYEVVLNKVKTQTKKAPLSPEEMEHIMQVADDMDAKERFKKENEIDELFNGYKVTSKMLH